MARAAKLSKKKVGRQTYWVTTSGGKPVYFGNVKDVSRAQAEEAFLDHRKGVLTNGPVRVNDVTVLELCTSYIAWAKENLAPENYEMKKSVFGQWCNHIAGTGAVRHARIFGAGKRIHSLPAVRITSAHLDDFIAARRREYRLVGISGTKLERLKGKFSIGPVAGKVDLNSAIKARLLEVDSIGNNLANKIIAARPFTSVDDLDALFRDGSQPVGPTALRAAQTQIKAAWRWGREEGRKLPPNCNPFATVKHIKIPAPLKLEGDLLTPSEVEALFATGDRYEMAGFGDLLRCYYAIGPRTNELARIRVGDVELRKRQVTLGKHKRANTLTKAKPRILTLNDTAFGIMRDLCQGKSATDYLFQQPNKRHWTTDRLCKCFQEVRELAGITREVTIYDFRHLWISDLLETETPIALIADMAGTSISQIEKTYGHIRTARKSEAQDVLDNLRARKKGLSIAG